MNTSLEVGIFCFGVGMGSVISLILQHFQVRRLKEMLELNPSSLRRP